MGTPDWRTGQPLVERLHARPASFDFFQWVRLQSWPGAGTLDIRTRQRGAREASGHLRFRNEMSPVFPGSEISAGRLRQERTRALSVSRRDGTKRTELFVSNFVLSGVLGPMPDSFAEWIRQRLIDSDPGMAEFLDIFNHRLSALRYALKAASVPAFDAVRPEYTRYADAVGALMGLTAFQGEGATILQREVPLPKRALLALAGLVGQGRKSVAPARLILSIYLDAPVRIEEWVGAWRPIEARDQTRLGRRRLKDTAPLGRRVWVNHAGIRLHVGPIPYARLCTLLNDRVNHNEEGVLHFGDGYRGLVALVRYLFDRHVDVEVEVTLDDDGAPIPGLGGTGVPGGTQNTFGARLGQTSWVSGAPGEPRRVRFSITADDSGASA
ncbi:type VI secretion system protein ImpH [Luteibacter sp. Sphag1AF]|uniref:type VI secretion system baseplate subunit TssG n=1 Tax=Luteibacter sp. Sphag1AF TaxID=2587031 RepID=UPI001620AFF4|nr:type VI secretion system baseplate subunit TssG [Luteibacter sp. Sphag1AF]MBB3228067.1 type VI secretion system protein ImpH [Luteibacter sp. Sphag1AF]